MNDVIQETEEQAAARLQRRRTQKAIGVASDAVGQLRTLVQHPAGRTEAGVEVREHRTPLISVAADAADEIYATLQEWSAFWAGELNVPSPLGKAPIAWRLLRDDAPIAGFKPDTGSRAAKQIVSKLTIFLGIHMREMIEHPAELPFMEAINESVWSGFAIAGLNDFREREVSPSICPACGEREVNVEFFGGTLHAARERGEDLAANVEGVEVRCVSCGWTAPTRPSKLATYLPWSAAENVETPTMRRWVRVQMRRDRPWQTKPPAVKIDRSTKYGNPFSWIDIGRAKAVQQFREMLANPEQRAALGYPTDDEIRADLGGHDLACWCPADEPCHGDPLLEIANP